MTGAVIGKAIARGVQEKVFGYITGPAPELNEQGKYQVTSNKVHLGTIIPPDEIDLEAGFLILPKAIPQAEAVKEPPLSPSTPGGGSSAGAGATIIIDSVTSRPEKSTGDRTVEICFAADRNQLFTAWNAIANLADLAGKVTVIVQAESAEGFEQSKLQNGVFEPLREMDLIK